MKSGVLAAALVACIVPGAASAATIILDGVADAAYGGAQSSVTHSASAAEGNFGSPTNENKGEGYSIFLKGLDGYVYGLIKGDGNGASPGGFANLYFDLDQLSLPSGSDLGFEVTAGNVFVPATGSKVSAPGISYFATADSVEFAIPVSYFTSAFPGLNYDFAGQFPVIGDSVRLNLSQSLGYSVAGGAGDYGTNRLGTAALTAAPAVPEPATWAMMLAGFGLLGGAMRRRIAPGAAMSTA
ncbi:MAG: sorting protein [Bradyrhizobium sp.]|nr:sorting protein [Bradyrhizobium sp.]